MLSISTPVFGNNVVSSDARCIGLGPGSYLLKAQIGTPTSTNKARKSDYVKAEAAVAEWNKPFGVGRYEYSVRYGRGFLNVVATLGSSRWQIQRGLERSLSASIIAGPSTAKTLGHAKSSSAQKRPSTTEVSPTLLTCPPRSYSLLFLHTVLKSPSGAEVGRLELTAEAMVGGLATLGEQAQSDVGAMKQGRDVPALPYGSNPIPALASTDPWMALRDRLKALGPIVAAVDELAKVPP